MQWWCHFSHCIFYWGGTHQNSYKAVMAEPALQYYMAIKAPFSRWRHADLALVKVSDDGVIKGLLQLPLRLVAGEIHLWTALLLRPLGKVRRERDMVSFWYCFCPEVCQGMAGAWPSGRVGFHLSMWYTILRRCKRRELHTRSRFKLIPSANGSAGAKCRRPLCSSPHPGEGLSACKGTYKNRPADTVRPGQPLLASVWLWMIFCDSAVQWWPPGVALCTDIFAIPNGFFWHRTFFVLHRPASESVVNTVAMGIYLTA